MADFATYRPKKEAQKGNRYEFTYQHPEDGTVEIKEWPHEAKDPHEDEILKTNTQLTTQAPKGGS